jgi:hypothetical protein
VIFCHAFQNGRLYLGMVRDGEAASKKLHECLLSLKRFADKSKRNRSASNACVFTKETMVRALGCFGTLAHLRAACQPEQQRQQQQASPGPDNGVEEQEMFSSPPPAVAQGLECPRLRRVLDCRLGVAFAALRDAAAADIGRALDAIAFPRTASRQLAIGEEEEAALLRGVHFLTRLHVLRGPEGLEIQAEGAGGGGGEGGYGWSKLLGRALVQPLVQPVAARFRYHFLSAKSATNRVDKPEWAIRFAQDMATHHAELFARVVQPAVQQALLERRGEREDDQGGDEREWPYPTPDLYMSFVGRLHLLLVALFVASFFLPGT